MKIIGWDGKSALGAPHHVEIWYNRHARLWTVQLKDENGFQLGNSEFSHGREEANRNKARLQRENNLPES